MKFFSFLLTIGFSCALSANLFIVPSKEVYSDFLIEPWKPNAASVIVFKDPNCGYCIRALKRLDKYKDYNVFMFWAPILGKSSERQVDSIFQCEQPVGEEVILAVVNREEITCKKSTRNSDQLTQLNKEIVDNYSPQSVPSYYFGGQKVWLSTLNRFKKVNKAAFNSITLDWKRYQTLKIDQNGHQGLANAVVFLPETSDKTALQNKLKNDVRYNWYIVDVCLECAGLTENKLSQELMLLFNVEEQDELNIAINGVLIEPERYSKFKLESLFDNK
jgi:glutaredoxin